MQEGLRETDNQRPAYLKMFLAATALTGIVYFSELQPVEDIIVSMLEHAGEGASAVKG